MVAYDKEKFVLAIYPFHLNLRACAMDWHTRCAGSRGNASAGLLAECIDVVPCTSSSENFAFHGDKMGGKDQ